MDMTLSDDHLEQALRDYDSEILFLRTGKSDEGLMEALTCRSTINLLLEDFDSCVSDADEALNIYDQLTSEGKKVDPGVAIKNLENRGQLSFDSDVESMVSDYRRIAELLKKISNTAKFYPLREMIVMCLDCATDLVDKDRFDDALPFVAKAEEAVKEENSVWGDNRRIVIYNLLGQCHKEGKRFDEAKTCFERAGKLAMLVGEEIEDRMEVAFSYINIGDICQIEKDVNGMIFNHEKAIKVLERMNSEGKLDDMKLLIDLYHGVATELMDMGKVKEAEKHLMAAMNLDMPAMTETMKNLGLKKHD